ncbi:hypothetical protein EVAR_59056_1 [Eumeta japonica]|uniref:Uncharacterized protein n=1 Tax=Eumeta variegata TaxID=151549 RepID=A0A4C1YFE6_EUMVA|nr:hypothetical protein EVAR_59056_1 [Eumeta japonica]
MLPNLRKCGAPNGMNRFEGSPCGVFVTSRPRSSQQICRVTYERVIIRTSGRPRTAGGHGRYSDETLMADYGPVACLFYKKLMNLSSKKSYHIARADDIPARHNGRAPLAACALSAAAAACAN